MNGKLQEKFQRYFAIWKVQNEKQNITPSAHPESLDQQYLK